MSDHPFPQDEPEPDLALVARSTFAVFMCLACEHHYAGDIPAIFEELPRCVLCGSGSQIERILM